MFARFLVILVLAAVVVGVFVHVSRGSGHARVYVVQPADTLWSIAQSHYGGDPRAAVWKLEQANRLGGDALIHPGQKLLLP